MITDERKDKARQKLIGEADAIENHCDRLLSIMASDFLRKWNGKVVNRRIYAPLARKYGLQETILRNGEPWFRDVSFEMDYWPAPLSSNGGKVWQVKIEVCKGWGKFGVPLATDNNGRLDSAETIVAWNKIIDLCRKWAFERRGAAEMVYRVAIVYNEIEKKVLEFFETEFVGGNLGRETTVLCSFGGDIYDRLNAFRWKERNPEV